MQNNKWRYICENIINIYMFLSGDNFNKNNDGQVSSMNIRMTKHKKNYQIRP